MPDIWKILIIDPMVNSLLFLYQLLFNNFTLSITVFTILVRVLTYPLNAQSQKSSKKMTELQQSDEWKKMQEKYAKDREKLSQEQMKLYQHAGVNPFGGCLPMIIQFPILIGLYQAITLAMAALPGQNRGLPDPYYVLPVVVVLSTWIQSKVMTPPSADAQAAQMSQTMAIYMPLMIGWMPLQFPS